MVYNDGLLKKTHSSELVYENVLFYSILSIHRIFLYDKKTDLKLKGNSDNKKKS